MAPSLLGKDRVHRWLVTGAAGFIGSHLLETLLSAGQEVVGLDNFSTGHQYNLDEVCANLDVRRVGNFRMETGDIRDRQCCAEIVQNIDFVLHQAALGSVPASLIDPLMAHDVNVTGFLNLLDAARVAKVKRFVYAASSATYGDDPTLPKSEDRIGNPLSPYAVTKFVNEVYAKVYARAYGFKATGLRYFNVFGSRQDPDGPYAAVIPKWVAAMIAGQPVTINGDGETSRDFCYVANAVQANLRAAFAPLEAQGEVYNIALGHRTTLNQLFRVLRDSLAEHQIGYDLMPNYGAFREGDVQHSQASIEKAKSQLNYSPTHDLIQGMAVALPWYVSDSKSRIRVL